VSEDLSDERVIRAVAHPLRRQILTILDRETASSKELAKRLGESLGSVSYHVAVLRELGLLEVVQQQRRRGAIETHYRSEPRPTINMNGWAGLSRTVRRSRWQAELRELAAALESAGRDRVLEADDATIARRTLALDREGRAAAQACVQACWRRLDEISTESQQRSAPDDPPAAIVVATLVFPAGSEDEASPA